ncbi:MAG: alpha/beta hydrolase [Kofleriaceae bacterium]
MSRSVTRTVVAASLVLSVTGAGCMSGPQELEQAQAAAAPAAELPVTPARGAVTPRIAFAPCEEDPELECGSLRVPVSYAQPRGEQLALAVVRARATGPRRLGALFVNPGGPGGSGVDFVILAKELFAPLRQEFDILSFDPRGTNRSGSADCTLDLPAPPADGSLESTARYLDQLSALYATACATQVGPLATSVGTNNVARDMDVLRAALGERELNYLGFSYGTILGASYATLFPGRVRAMVLDGNVSPSWFSDHLVEFDAEGSAGAELALRHLDARCRADAACPLRSAGVVTVFDRVVDRLNRSPVVVGDSVINGQSVASLTFGAMYNEQVGWPFVVDLLVRVDAGDYRGLPPTPPADGTVTVPSTFAIVCSDSRSRRGALDYLPTQIENNQLYPRFGGENFGIAPTACAAWPASTSIPVTNLRTRRPIVLIGNDYDPATPLTWSRAMATALGHRAALVRYRGGGHTIFGSGSACVDSFIASYLHHGAPPAAGATCPAVPLSFSASVRAQRGPSMADVLTRVAPAPKRLLGGR